MQVKRRIAVFARRDREDHVRCGPQIGREGGAGPNAVEHVQPIGAFSEPLAALFAAPRAGDRRIRIDQLVDGLGRRQRRISEAEKEHVHQSSSAVHSARTLMSDFGRQKVQRQMRGVVGREVGAAPRLRHRARPDRDLLDAAAPRHESSVSPLLPMAISTLRRNRSCPIRLIGEAEKNPRNAASSSAARSAKRRGAADPRGPGAWPPAQCSRTCSRADGEAVVAAIDAVAHRLAELARDRARRARW